MPRELEAQRRLADKRCPSELGWVFPGLGQMCHRKDVAALTLGTLAVVEAETAMAVGTREDTLDHPGVLLPLVGLQNLWAYGLAEVSIDGDIALQRSYAPQDSLDELAVAPFNGEVLRRPDVWGSILGASTVALVAVALTGDDIGPVSPKDVNWFGRQVRPEAGYPLAGATFAALFSHVAIGEEAVFRGLIQSRIARVSGETDAWIAGTIIFGAAHTSNIGVIEDQEDRIRFIALGLPIITMTGGLIGWSYRLNDYSLAPPVAIHFWYDFILSAVGFAADPQNSVLSARVAVPMSL